MQSEQVIVQMKALFNQKYQKLQVPNSKGWVIIPVLLQCIEQLWKLQMPVDDTQGKK